MSGRHTTPNRQNETAAFVITQIPRWTDTTSAQAAKYKKAHKSSPQKASQSVNRIWDKCWNNDNQANAAYTTAEYKEEATFPLSYKIDSLQHRVDIRSHRLEESIQSW